MLRRETPAFAGFRLSDSTAVAFSTGFMKAHDHPLRSRVEGVGAFDT